MSPYNEPPDATNPFSSSRIRPGALPFLFASPQSAASLVERLARNGWWGQVVGPHGSGKSALLSALVPAIEGAGRRVELVTLHDGQRRLPIELAHFAPGAQPALLAIDGYEQLGRWQRFRWKRACRRRAMGLLVTAHSSVGLPHLCHTAPDLDLAQGIVEQLQRSYPKWIGADDVAERLARHDGDVREMLFDLYDLYEQRRQWAGLTAPKTNR